MITFDEIKIKYDIANEILTKKWATPNENFHYCEDHCVVKINGTELRVKEKTIMALKLLTFGFRFQKDSKVLPTKEEFMLACGIRPERKGREFKVLKELFPYPELQMLVKYDRKRKGYYLCLS